MCAHAWQMHQECLCLMYWRNFSRTSHPRVKITFAAMPRSARPSDGAFPIGVGRDGPLGMGGSKCLGALIWASSLSLYQKAPCFCNGGSLKVGSRLPSYQDVRSPQLGWIAMHYQAARAGTMHLQCWSFLPHLHPQFSHLSPLLWDIPLVCYVYTTTLLFPFLVLFIYTFILYFLFFFFMKVSLHIVKCISLHCTVWSVLTTASTYITHIPLKISFTPESSPLSLPQSIPLLP